MRARRGGRPILWLLRMVEDLSWLSASEDLTGLRSARTWPLLERRGCRGRSWVLEDLARLRSRSLTMGLRLALSRRRLRSRPIHVKVGLLRGRRRERSAISDDPPALHGLRARSRVRIRHGPLPLLDAGDAGAGWTTERRWGSERRLRYTSRGSLQAGMGCLRIRVHRSG